MQENNLNLRKIFWKNIELVRQLLWMDDQKFSEFVDMGYKDFMNLKLSGEFLPLMKVYHLSYRTNIHYKEFFSGSFDIAPLLGSLTDNAALDERYVKGAYSSTVLVKNTLTYVEKSFGVRAKIDVMKGFKINQDLLNKPGARVNLDLNKDIASYLRASYCLSDDNFIEVGRMSSQTLKDTPIAKGLMDKSNVMEMLEYFIQDCAVMLDLNHEYKITKLNSDFAVIEGVARKEVLDELQVSPERFGNESACFNRMGIMSSFTYFKYGTFAKMTRITSVYHGDKSTCYLVDLSQFR